MCRLAFSSAGLSRPAALLLAWFLLASLLITALSGCAPAPESTNTPDGGTGKTGFTEISYTHYSSGGTAEEYPAVILFEESNSTFTCYQVAFCSCTCRDSLVNYYSVCYVELLNTRPSAELSAIRAISFGNNQGLYGDSNPNYYRHDYTEEYMDEHFIQQLVNTTKGEFDAWQGYGTQLEVIDADAVSGASVSTGNITSLLRSLFAYHADKYY